MKAAFHLVCSVGAAFLTKEEREELATEAVKRVEKIEPKSKFFILNDDRGLKIVVEWEKRAIWIMATHEAEKGGLPTANENDLPPPSAN